MIWSWLGGWKWIGTALHRNMLLSVCARARVTLTKPMLKYGCVCLCVCCFLHWGVWVCAIWQLRRMKRMRRLGRGPRYDDSFAPCVLPLCGPNKHVCLSYSTPQHPHTEKKAHRCIREHINIHCLQLSFRVTGAPGWTILQNFLRFWVSIHSISQVF